MSHRDGNDDMDAEEADWVLQKSIHVSYGKTSGKGDVKNMPGEIDDEMEGEEADLVLQKTQKEVSKSNEEQLSLAKEEELLKTKDLFEKMVNMVKSVNNKRSLGMWGYNAWSVLEFGGKWHVKSLQPFDMIPDFDKKEVNYDTGIPIGFTGHYLPNEMVSSIVQYISPETWSKLLKTSTRLREQVLVSSIYSGRSFINFKIPSDMIYHFSLTFPYYTDIIQNITIGFAKNADRFKPNDFDSYAFLLHVFNDKHTQEIYDYWTGKYRQKGYENRYRGVVSLDLDRGPTLFNDYKIQSSALSDCMMLLTANKTMKHLSLPSIMHGDEHFIDALSLMIELNTGLEYLSINEDWRLDVRRIFESLQKNKTLRTLEISLLSTESTDDWNPLAYNYTLKKFKLRVCSFNGTFNHFCLSLSKTNISSLKLFICYGVSFDGLAQLLRDNINITSLSLIRMKLSEEFIQPLISFCKVLSARNVVMEKLDLSQCELPIEWISLLSKAIKEGFRVKNLKISRMEISETDVDKFQKVMLEDFSSSIEFDNVLTTLDLSYLPIETQDDFAQVGILSEIIKKSKSIKRIKVGSALTPRDITLVVNVLNEKDASSRLMQLDGLDHAIWNGKIFNDNITVEGTGSRLVIADHNKIHYDPFVRVFYDTITNQEYRLSPLLRRNGKLYYGYWEKDDETKLYIKKNVQSIQDAIERLNNSRLQMNAKAKSKNRRHRKHHAESHDRDFE